MFSNRYNSTESENDTSFSKRRKKKKRKLHDSESCIKDESETQQTNSDKGFTWSGKIDTDKEFTQSGKIRHIESLKNELGLTEFKKSQLKREKVSEKSDLGTKNAPEVVVFASHKKKQREVALRKLDHATYSDFFQR